MKIGPPLNESLAAAGAVTKASAPSASAAAAPAHHGQSPGVAVSLSSKALALGGAAASTNGDVDMARVEAFRAAIAAGTFKPNAEAIADKLLANAQEMLDRTRL